MNIQAIKAELTTARGHLHAVHTEGYAGFDAAEHAAGLAEVAKRELSRFAGYIPEAGKEPTPYIYSGVTAPDDVIGTVNIAAGQITQANETLNRVCAGSSNEHIGAAALYLGDATEHMRDGVMDAESQARIIKANINKISEGTAELRQLLDEIIRAGRYAGAALYETSMLAHQQERFVIDYQQQNL